MRVLDDYFYKLLKPKKFDGSEGEIAKFDKGFETTCTVMSQHISRDPKAMTTLEYMQTLEELRKQQKTRDEQMKKASRRSGK